MKKMVNNMYNAGDTKGMTDAQKKLVRLHIARPEVFVKQRLGWDLWDKQVEIINSVRDNPETFVQSCNAAGKCLAHGSLVQLANGDIVNAEDLIDKSFQILGYDQITGEQRPMLATAEDNGIKSVYEIVTSRGRRIRATGNHPIMTENGWKNASEISIDDVMVVPSKLHVEGDKRGYTSELKLVGYMLGNAYLYTNIDFPANSTTNKPEFKALCRYYKLRVKTSNNKRVAVYAKENSTNHALETSRKYGLFGMKYGTMRVPERVKTLDNASLALVLNRMMSTDRADVTDKRITITALSEGFIRDIEMLMLRFGISGYVMERRVRLRGDRSALTWVYVTTEVEKLVDRIGVHGKDDNIVVGDYDDYEYHDEPVISIKKLPEQPTVSISVPESNAYVTTFVEHNTHLAAAIVLWWILTRRGKVVTTAPTWRQVRDLLWAKIGAMARNVPGLGVDPMQADLKIAPEWYATGLSTRVPDKFQGYHGNVLIIVDEACGVDDEEIWNAMDGCMTDRKHDRMLAIGNPTNPNTPFARKCGSPGSQRKVIEISAFDTPNVKTGKEVIPGLVTREWVEQKKAEWGESSPFYLARVLGQFPRTASDSLYPLSWLDYAFNYDTTPDKDGISLPDLSIGTSSIGLDVAASGADNNAMTFRSGGKVVNITGWPGIDTEEIVVGSPGISHPSLYGWVDMYRPEVVYIDSVGVGYPIYREARKHKKSSPKYTNLRVRSFMAQRKAVKEDMYANAKAEAYYNLRELLRLGKVDLSSIKGDAKDLIERQANAVRYESDNKGRVVIEKKSQVKGRTGHSPDELESLIMAFYSTGAVKVDKDATARFDYDGERDSTDTSLVASFSYDFDTYGR